MGAYFLKKQARSPILEGFGRNIYALLSFSGQQYLQNGLPLDMDVYDLAEWCCLAELGELSMDNGCAAVTFPDFTRGEWNKVKGYRHAYAAPADEEAAMEKAKAFTSKLKEQGAKEWAATEE